MDEFEYAQTDREILQRFRNERTAYKGAQFLEHDPDDDFGLDEPYLFPSKDLVEWPL